jgi:SAM-dependent methyltransferase
MLGDELNFIQELHNSTNRNYTARMLDEKVEAMDRAKLYEEDYWDGDRRYGYGGYRYIEGRWKEFAEKLIEKYSLTSDSKILDLGCGKGFLLFEIQKLIPGVKLYGVDISNHAIANLHPELEIEAIILNAGSHLPFMDKEFDLVMSINTLHNLSLLNFENAISNMMRLGKHQYLVVESFRDSQEQFNLQCWALTANLLLSKDDWLWLFLKSEYFGDFEFIYFQ